MNTRAWCALVSLCFLAGTGRAGAEPRFLSKQYNRCSSCHYSATGGGLLTPYGRSLSGQELSTTRHVTAQPSAEGTVGGEEAFLYDALGQALGPVQLGITVRPSYLHYTSGTFSDSRDLLMNADIEGAYRGHGWTVYGEAGRMPAIGTEDAKLYSREHWVSYEGARGFAIKAGRYMPAYGVYLSDHTSLNRNDLGFDKYDQVYGLEVSHTSERALVQVSVSPGRAESFVNDDGGQAFNTTGRLQVDFGPKVVLVGSGLYRDASSLVARHGATGGALGLAPFKRLAIWTEGDAYIRGNNGGTSFVFANETAFEAFRGVWLRVSPQSRSTVDQFPGVFRWDVGADLLPRTHYHVTLDFYHDKTDGNPDPLKTFLAQLHVYL
jgi:hypothetical protein